MPHYHKARGQQKSKWERFKQHYGMSPSEWRALKKSDPTKAHDLRMKVDKIRIATFTSIKTKNT